VSPAELLSARMEAGVRRGEAHSMGVIPTLAQRLMRADNIRSLLRLSAREGLKLTHGDIKHARDVIRSIEKQAARL
jgi:hypothetical protein